MDSYQFTHYHIKTCEKILSHLHEKPKHILRLYIEFDEKSTLEKHFSICLNYLERNGFINGQNTGFYKLTSVGKTFILNGAFKQARYNQFRVSSLLLTS